MQLDQFRIYTENKGTWHYEADPDISFRVLLGEGRSNEQAAAMSQRRTTILVVLNEDDEAGQHSVTSDSEMTIQDLADSIELMQTMHRAHKAVRA